MSAGFSFLFHQPLRLCQLVFSLLFSYLKSIGLSSSSLILSFHLLFNTETIQWDFYFCCCIFQFCHSHWFLKIISCRDFLSIHLFVSREFVIGCWSIFMATASTSLSDNFNIRFILIGISVYWLSFLIQVVIFLVLGIMFPGLVVYYVRIIGVLFKFFILAGIHCA